MDFDILDTNLIDVTEMAQANHKPMGAVTGPVFLSEGVWGLLKGTDGAQGRVWELLWLARLALQRRAKDGAKGFVATFKFNLNGTEHNLWTIGDTRGLCILTTREA